MEQQPLQETGCQGLLWFKRLCEMGTGDTETFSSLRACHGAGVDSRRGPSGRPGRELRGPGQWCPRHLEAATRGGG